MVKDIPVCGNSVCSVLFIVLLTASLLASSVMGQDAPGFRVDFEKNPLWVISGAWSGAGDKLYLADTMRQEIIAINLEGEVLPPQSVPLDGTGHSSFSLLRSGRSGFLLELSDGAILRLDEDLNKGAGPVTNLVGTVSSQSTGQTRTVASLFAWAAVGDHVFAFGDIKQDSPPWVSGFLEIPLANPADFDFFLDLRLSLGDPIVSFYQLGLNLIEAQGSTAYVLVMDDPPYLTITEPGEEPEIVAVESVCGQRPSVPKVSGFESLPPAYRALERSEGPLGVYSQGDHVFLLCRKQIDGSLGFALAEVDLSSGEAISLVPIETDAAHLTIIPGPRYWAFVEKGPVVAAESGGPYMPITSVQMIPATTIGNPRHRSAGVATDKGILPAWVRTDRLWQVITFLFGGIGVPLLFIIVPRLRALAVRSCARLWRFLRSGMGTAS